jgi:imidazolonepropionase
MSVKLKVDLLVRNVSQLVTMDPVVDGNPDVVGPRKGESMRSLGIIENGAVAVKDGAIVAIGKDADVMKEIGAVRRGAILNGSGRCVIPGFVDAHTHAIFAGTREGELVMRAMGKSYMEILAEGGGIQRTVRDTRAASDEEIVKVTRKRLNDMMLNGTTTAEVKSGYGLNYEQELRLLRLVRRLGSQHPITIVPTFMGAHAVPPEFKDAPDKYVDIVVEKVLPKVREEEMAKFCDVFCDEGAFTAAQSERILTKAKELGLGAKIHVDEFASTGGLDVAIRLKATSCEHLLMTPKEKFPSLASSGCIAVLLPGTPFVLASERYADARAMIDAGVPIALGTDLCPNAYIESMQFVIALACSRMNMHPSEALCAATINAAHAIGQGEFAGMIRNGRRADIVMLDLPSYTQIPYRIGTNLVHSVVKSGNLVVERGAHVQA